MVEEVVQDVPDPELPEITILCPVWKRHEFLDLFVMNLKNQDYPHNKLKVIIDDDSDSERFITDENELNQVKQFLHPIQVKYITGRPRRSIGKKRNDLVKDAETKIVCFFDSDDIYLPTAVSHTYETMINKKCKCAGSDKMLFCMTQKNFDIHAIDCGNNVKLVHEGGCLMFYKKWFRASCGFADGSVGEGKNLFFGMESKVAITDITKVMVCIQHEGNTVEKLQFAKDDNKVNINLAPQMIDLLKRILDIKD
jgi:glycosyltransferase involved in cell wall biosynthesis